MKHDSTNEEIEIHKRTVLSRRDWKAFLELLDSDDEPAPALKKAVERYQIKRVCP
jgi:uncharacterized protein (DUF1778 family)